LNQFVDTGDVTAIIRTLGVISADDSVPCNTKLAYLVELLGLVKDAIARKTAAADVLVPVIDSAKAEIARLQAEIDKIQRDRDALGIPALDGRVADLSAKLNNLNNQVNAVRAQIPP